MSKTVKELLSDPLKGTNRAKGILCYLFRHVLLWRKVNQFAWDKRARLFFQKEHNKHTKDKGNLNKALVHDEFTWGAFKMAIDFLNPMGASLTIVLTWKSGQTSRYSIIIDPAEDESDPVLNRFDVENPSDVFAENSKKPANTLARLFRKIVAEESISATQWSALLESYVRNPVNGVPQNSRDVTAAIGTLQRELLKSRMSWSVFRKGLNLLNPKQVDYILEMRWSNKPGDVTTHNVTMRDPLSMIPPTTEK